MLFETQGGAIVEGRLREGELSTEAAWFLEVVSEGGANRILVRDDISYNYYVKRGGCPQEVSQVA